MDFPRLTPIHRNHSKEGIHRLYLFLSAESVSYDSVPLIASDILKNVTKSLAGIE
jgi:hypothetical protein